LGALPAVQHYKPSRLNAELAIGYTGFGSATREYSFDSITTAPGAPLKWSPYGLNGYNSSIEDPIHMAGQDGLLNQTTLKFSPARNDPDRGRHGPAKFCDDLHNTCCPARPAGSVLFPLRAHEMCMIIEPCDSHRPTRTTNL
jgi:hypothetical protein